MTMYLNTAASQFNGIVQYTTLAVIQSMISAAGKPVFAKLADALGRAASFILSIVLFTVGIVTISSSQSIGALAKGMVFFSCGNTGSSFNLSLLVADLTSPRWRCTISNLLSVHFVVNFGIASKITSALVPKNWRWGVGMFSIINPCVTAPIILVLAWQQFQAAKAGRIRKYPYSGTRLFKAVAAFLFDVDFLGLFCFTSGFLLLLLPLTIAEKAPEGYKSGYIIAMFVVGGTLLLLWLIVEFYSPRPLLRVRSFFTNADIIIPGAILFVDQFSVALTMTPAFQWISIVYSWDTEGAAYFLYTQSLCLVVFSIVAGLAATYNGQYKNTCIAGACIRVLGLGLMMKYRGTNASTFQVVMPQVLMGLGGGLMTANVVVVAQAAATHDELSFVTGFILLVLELGAALGQAVTGAVQQTLRTSLHRYLDPITGGNTTVADIIYAQGSLAAGRFPLGSPIRDAAAQAWTDNMHQLIIAAISLAAVNLVTCVLLPNHQLKEKQHNNVESKDTGVLVPLGVRKNGN